MSRIDRIEAALDEGRIGEALAIAATLPDLGAFREPIVRAHEARENSQWFASLGHDLEAIECAGLAALRAKFEGQK